MLIKLNSKGQEFSVFKLLISAVIAVVILTLLLNILGLIGPIGQGEPRKESVEILKQAYNNRFNDYKTKAVTFSNNQKINNAGIATDSGLISASELCMVAQDSFNNDKANWEITTNYIMYKGGGQKQAYLAAYCDTGTSLQENLGNYASFLKESDGTTGVSVSGCGCASSEGTCCIVGLVKQ